MSTRGEQVCPTITQFFFKSGDARVNVQLNLIAMHTLWMREHNRVAEDLSKLNPDWNDERTFQEARRIVIAEYQHIIYNEWLPPLLGTDFTKAYRINPLSNGHSSDYDETLDPRVTNEFATAAFRFGHSIIPSTFLEIEDNR